MSEPIQTNFETDPYDDDIYALGNIKPIPVLNVGTATRSEAPEYGSWQGYTVPLLGSALPVQLLTRKPLRDEAYIYNNGAATSNSVSGYGSVTSPGAGAAVATIGNGTAPAGTYLITWTVELEGTVSATDIDNFRLHINTIGTNPFSNSLNPGAVGVYPQMPVTDLLSTTGVTVSAVAAGTVGAIYSAQISLTPVGNPIILSHRSDPLQLTSPVGWTLLPGNIVKFQAAQPVYAVAIGGPVGVSVLDQSWESVNERNR